MPRHRQRRRLPEVLVICPGDPDFAFELAADLDTPGICDAIHAGATPEVLLALRGAAPPAVLTVVVPRPPDGGLACIRAVRAAATTLPILGLYGRPVQKAALLEAGATRVRCLPCHALSLYNVLLDLLPAPARRLRLVPRRA